MPELPEVETIKRQLGKSIVDKKITGIKINLPKIVKTLLRKNFVSDGSAAERKTPLKEFKRAVLGSVIKSVKRRAKLLIIELSGGHSLLIHLKMTGQLIFLPPRSCRTRFGISHKILKQVQDDKKRNYIKHTHLIFHFSEKSQLIYNDLRQFGYIKLIKTDRIGELDKEYGPEPLDKNFTLSAFRKLLAKKPKHKRKSFSRKPSFRPAGRKIKQFLMDQKNIAGIGNLYADEILFYAGIMPTRIISALTKNEIKKIHTGIKKILTEAIKYHGSSVDNYLDARGRAGEYHLRLKVYGRANQPCKKCGAKIQKTKLAGRGTHFCPRCQK